MSKTMHLIVVIAVGVVTLGIGALAFAQDGEHGKHKRWRDMTEQERMEMRQKRLDRKIDRLDQKLELTDEQEKELRKIYETKHAEMRDIRKRMHKQMRETRQEMKAEFERVLDDEQEDTFKEMRRARHEKRAERRIERMKENLDLTDEQVGKIDEIFEETRSKIQAVRDDESLSENERRDKVRSLFFGAKDQVTDVLDEAQREKFEKMRRDRRGHHGRHGRWKK